MKRIIILSLILLVLTTGMVSAYTYGDDVNNVEMPRVDQTMTIDFTTSITDRWMNPVDRVIFDESGGEYYIQPIEITADFAKLYVSTENKLVIMEPGEEASFQFGDALISVAFLEGYTWKGHFDFARENNPIVVETPVEETVKEVIIPEDSSSSDSSNFPWWVIAVGVAVLVAILLVVFMTKRNK